MRKSFFPFSASLFFLVLTSCMVGPDYHRPSAPTLSTFKEEPPASVNGLAWKKAQPSDAIPRGKWWEVYHDPDLNALEEQVNISNQNILAAEAQYRSARATVRVAKADLYPNLTANPSVTAGQPSENANFGTPAGRDQPFGSNRHTQTDYFLPLDLTYLADIWGEIRRNVEENVTAAQASAANLQNARLSYQAELAVDYFEAHGLDAEKQLLESTVNSYEKYLQLTQNRYNGGIASQGDVAQAKTQLETARVQLIDVGVARAQYEHAIAVLLGKPPAAFSLPEAPLKGTPLTVPVGVPSEILERRPDIASAERTMASANAAIGVATAAYYPALTLSASTGVESISLSNLFSGPSFLWSVGAAVAQPVFDAGRIHAEVVGARANYDNTVANYRQTVLTAFQQIEDDLAGLRILEKEAAAQEAAVQAAEQSVVIFTNEYKAGTQSYLQVITAQTAALTNEVNRVSIYMRRMTTSVLLIEAVGGGWESSQLPTEHEVSILPREPSPSVRP